MNMHYRLNSGLVKERLRMESRKQMWLAINLGVSYPLVRTMLDHGHIPKKETLEALARLLGVRSEDLLVKHVA